jgi:hypothetical protein
MGTDNSDALHLSESISLAIEESATTVFDSDGCVPVHIIRPGVGKGRGRHLYEANMLRANAHKFTGWRMYVDHQSPEARRAAGGLPRSIRDLGGRIVESHWDGSVPADPKRGYGQGAVVGRAKPVPMIRDLIEADPHLVEASISASATGVKPVTHDGQRVWMVEGINDRGSVDWVTEAGAGGRIAPLIESSYSTEEEVEMALLESLNDDELRDLLREERPGLLVQEADYDDDDDDTPDALAGDEADGKSAKKKGKSVEDDADKIKTLTTQEASEQEGDMAITPEQLQEALVASPDLLLEALANNENVGTFIAGQVSQTLASERELIEAEQAALRDRDWELRDLQDHASTLITESRLPDTWQDGLRARFSLNESRQPSADLDVVADLDADGNVTKTAVEKLTEAVNAAIKTDRKRLAEVAPTRVRGQGLSQLQEGDGEESDEPKGEPGFHRQLLQEAGINYDEAYKGL